MSTLAISSIQPRNWQRPGTTAKLKIWFGQNFVTAEALSILGGPARTSPLFVNVDCTVDTVNHRLEIPSFSLPTTDDSSVRNVRASGLLFDSSGAYVEAWFANWVIPEELAPACTFAQLEAFNAALRNPPPPPGSTTPFEVEVLINNALGTLNNASDVVIGRTLLDVAPADAAAPTAIGLNSRRVTEMYNVQATAIGAVGDGTTNDRAALNTLVNTTLQITGAGGDVYFPAGTYLIGSGMTFPANVRLVFDPRAMLKIATGTTTIIAGAIDAAPYKIFDNATAGLGTISFAGNTRLGDIYPNWWGAVGDDSTDCAPAFQAMLAVNWYNGSLSGARFRVPTGIYRIGATLTYRGSFSTSFIMEGESLGEAGAGDGPTLKYTGSSGGTLMQWLGANWCQLRNVQLDGNALALRDLVIDYDTSRSMSSFDCHVDHCNFGGAVGVDSCCLVLGTSNAASAEHLVTNSRFISQGVAGTTYYGIRNFGSANAKDHTVNDCDIINFRYGIVFGNSGYNQANGCSFAGNTIAAIDPSIGQVAVRTFSSEGDKTFITNSGFARGGLTLEDGYYAGSGDASGYVVVYSGRLFIKNTDWFCGPSAGDNPPKFKTGFGGAGGGIVSENNTYNWNAVTAADFIPFYNGSDQLIATLAVANAATSSLFSTGDAAVDVSGNVTVSFPTWSTQGNIGVYPKVILAAFWAGANTYSIAYGDSVILTECATGPFGSGYNVIDLGTPTNGKGRKALVIKTDNSAFPIAVTNGFTANINGTKLDAVLLTHQFDFVELESDGTSWRVIRYQIGELSGQLTVGGGGTITYTWKNRWVSAPICLASDTNAAPAAAGASSTTTTLTATGTAAHVLSYIATSRDL